jgi:hypothetical protein
MICRRCNEREVGSKGFEAHLCDHCMDLNRMELEEQEALEWWLRRQEEDTCLDVWP